MPLGDYFVYRGGVNKRTVGLSPQEQQQIATVRKAIASTLGGQEDPKKIKEDKSKVSLSELKDLAVGDVHGTLNIFSKLIYASENTKKEKLKLYREMAKYPEISKAVSEYVGESVNFNEDGDCMDLVIRNKSVRENENQRKTLQAEFKTLMNGIIHVNDHIDMWFRDYIVDGEIFFEKIFDNDNPDNGILRVKKLFCGNCYPVYGDIEAEEILFFVYNNINSGEKMQAPKELIAYANSGFFEYSENENDLSVQSLLEPAKVTYRRLKLMEDALVIYRIVRAPERRIFNIDVGSLPKGRAEQYLRETIQRHRQKKFFDPTTGDVTEGLDPIAMTEDYYFPIFQNGKGTKVETLAGGQHLDQIQDVEFFTKKLYYALNVPLSRYSDDKKVQFGAEGEIDHDELKFLKEVKRFCKRFCAAFKDIYLTHLKLRGISDEFGISYEDIDIQMFSNNLYEMFLESKKLDLKFAVFNNFKDLIDTENKPLSQEWVIKKYLDIDENDWVENVKLRNIEREIAKRLEKEKEGSGGGGGGGGGGDLSSLGIGGGGSEVDVTTEPGAETSTEDAVGADTASSDDTTSAPPEETPNV